jgi:hypothetical protein
MKPAKFSDPAVQKMWDEGVAAEQKHKASAEGRNESRWRVISRVLIPVGIILPIVSPSNPSGLWVMLAGLVCLLLGMFALMKS